MTIRVLVGDVRAKLRELPADSFDCVVTSPPYWGLRDYGTGKWVGGSRVAAVVDALLGRVTDNRAYEFLRGKALRVDSWEKDLARRQRDRLRAAARVEKHRDHLEWLESQIGRFQASGDEELRGPHVDGLVHLLRMARAETGAVAVPAEDATDPAR